MLRTGKLDYICPIADEIHILLQASREDTGLIIDAIRNAIMETKRAVVTYSNARSHAIHMTDDKDASIFDQEHTRPNKHVDLNRVLEPWL